MTESDKDTAAVPDERREAWGENYRPRYSGVATFMRQQLCEEEAGWSEVEIGLIGVPFDGGVTNRPGARHGPRQLREQSTLMGSVNHQSGVRPYDLAAIDVPKLHQFSRFEIAGVCMNGRRMFLL